MVDTCHQCGKEYKKIATHWTMSSCDHKPFTDYQHEVCTGLLMGDGYIHRSLSTPKLVVDMTAKNYLNYLSNEVFSSESGEPFLKRSAERAAERSRERGKNPDAKAENYSNLYRWHTMCHPGLQTYANWYRSGSKVFPPNIELTPTVLKHWYCGDGSLTHHGCPKITLCNESDNKNKINEMFSRVELTDFFWKENKSETTIQFRAEGAENFFEHIGSPLPDFLYKWADAYQ